MVCMFCPFFILVCRYVHDLPLSASQLGMSAGVIVTFAGLVTSALCCLAVEMQPIDERLGGYERHVKELLGVDDSKISHPVTDAAEEEGLTRKQGIPKPEDGQHRGDKERNEHKEGETQMAAVDRTERVDGCGDGRARGAVITDDSHATTVIEAPSDSDDYHNQRTILHIDRE